MNESKIEESPDGVVDNPDKKETPAAEIPSPTLEDIQELIKINPTAGAQLSAIIWHRMYSDLAFKYAESQKDT